MAFITSKNKWWLNWEKQEIFFELQKRRFYLITFCYSHLHGVKRLVVCKVFVLWGSSQVNEKENSSSARHNRHLSSLVCVCATLEYTQSWGNLCTLCYIFSTQVFGMNSPRDLCFSAYFCSKIVKPPYQQPPKLLFLTHKPKHKATQTFSSLQLLTI